MRRFVTISVTSAALMLSATAVFAAEKPVKVFLLVGQSNMEGKGQSGHIDALLADPDTPAEEEAKFQNLVKDGKHVVRKDVWIWYLGKTGNLTVGFGNAAEKNGKPFGPELGFGHVVGDYFDQQVLLIKCAWGGKSLRRNFRPPSCPPTQAELDAALEKTRKKDPNATMESIKESYGFYYRETVRLTKGVLANLKTHFPDYDPAEGYEIAGMVWFQG